MSSLGYDDQLRQGGQRVAVSVMVVADGSRGMKGPEASRIALAGGRPNPRELRELRQLRPPESLVLWAKTRKVLKEQREKQCAA